MARRRYVRRYTRRRVSAGDSLGLSCLATAILVLLALTAIFSLISFLFQNPLILVAVVVVVLAAVGAGIGIWAWTRQRARLRAQIAWQRELFHRSTIDGLLALTPTQFEDFVARLLAASGYRQVQRVGGAGDLSADVRAIAPDGRSTVVQCKLYAPGRSVDSPAVQQLVGMAYLHHGAQLAMIITTSDLTQPAAILAQQHAILVINGRALTDWVQRVRSAATPQPAQPTTKSRP